jgi:hypothetical protein
VEGGEVNRIYSDEARRQRAVASSARWRRDNPGKYLASLRAASLRRVGTTIAGYDEMHAAQRGLCAICGRPESMRDKFGRVQRLAVDHCHATLRVRGLLCGNCNHALGKFQDDPARLRAAADYIEAHRKAIT